MQAQSGLQDTRSRSPAHPIRTGIPAKKSIPGAGRKKLLMPAESGSTRPWTGSDGERRSGPSEITADFVQINARVTAYGDKTLDELFPKVEGEKAEKKRKSPRQKIRYPFFFMIFCLFSV
ncbi:MAG: hypothetical protein MZV49_19750 [Rhodopseudomonas palustris]|nr:hypothetical protein [Rhodopseudomonas palustris]